MRPRRIRAPSPTPSLFCTLFAPLTALRKALSAGPLRMLLPALWPRFAGYCLAIAPVYRLSHRYCAELPGIASQSRVYLLLPRYRAGLPGIASLVRRFTGNCFAIAGLPVIASLSRRIAGYRIAGAPVYRLSLPFCAGAPPIERYSAGSPPVRRFTASAPVHR